MVKEIVAAYRTQIYIQRIFLLSPLRIHSNGDISTDWHQLVYTYCGLLIFVVCTILLFLSVDRVSYYYAANGLVWLIAAFCDFLLSKIAYIVIIILVELKKHQQILFFQSLVRIDHILQEKFNITSNYAICRRVNLLTICFIIVCYSCSTIEIGSRALCLSIYTKYEVPALILTYFAELCAFAMVVTIYINGVALIGNKFSIITKLLLNKQVIQDAEKLTKLLEIYIEMINVINIWNDYIGWIIMIRLAHDFMTSTTTSYLLFTTILDNSEKLVAYNIPAWLLQTVMRIVLIIGFSEQTIAKVGVQIISFLSA